MSVPTSSISQRDGHGNLHRHTDSVVGVVIPYPTAGTPIDLLGLKRVRATVDGRAVEANFDGPEALGESVTVFPHVINGKVWSFRKADLRPFLTTARGGI
jgi:hypothetical protein